MGKFKITKTDTSGQIHDRFAMQDQQGGANVGGTGGLTSQTGRQIQVRVKIGSNANANGSILAKKGRKIFRVTDGTNTGNCMLVNKANGSLLANEMSILITLLDTTTAYASRITNKFVWDFAGNKYRYHLATQATPFVMVAYA